MGQSCRFAGPPLDSGAGAIVRLCPGFSPQNENFGCTVILRSTEIASGVTSNSKFRLRCWRSGGGASRLRAGAARRPPPHKSLSGPLPLPRPTADPPGGVLVWPCRGRARSVPVMSVSVSVSVSAVPFVSVVHPVRVLCCDVCAVWISAYCSVSVCICVNVYEHACVFVYV